MFTRRISIVLIPVVLVAVSVLAVQLLLFAQEGGEVCNPGGSSLEFSPSNAYGNYDATGQPHIWIRRDTWKNTGHDSACVPHECPQPPCVLKDVAPKSISVTTTTNYVWQNNDWVRLGQPVEAPPVKAGTRKEC